MMPPPNHGLGFAQEPARRPRRGHRRRIGAAQEIVQIAYAVRDEVDQHEQPQQGVPAVEPIDIDDDGTAQGEQQNQVQHPGIGKAARRGRDPTSSAKAAFMRITARTGGYGDSGHGALQLKPASFQFLYTPAL